MNPRAYKNDEIKAILSASLGRLFEQDDFLLRYAAHERSVAHKIAVYLGSAFEGHRHVDLEYNLHGHLIKRLAGIQECDDERRTDRIFPDIVVHMRGTDEFNTLVVEVKTGNGSRACDVRKLQLLTDPSNGYGYQLGVFLRFNGQEDVEIVWFPT